MILIDTSVWIEAFRDGSSRAAQVLTRSLEEGKVVISGIILVELLQGARTKKEYNLLLKRLKVVPVLNPDNDTWKQAAKLAFHLKRKGVTIANSIDIIIAAIAIQNKLQLYSFDKHFALISNHTKLDLIY